MDLTDSLRKHFGFDEFRRGQGEALDCLLAGRHALVVMPTGSGKSLIYQLAALILPGMVLVISPLIALMKDQVDSLTRRGIPATFINSSLTALEQNKRLHGLSEGLYRLVYIAPERLRSEPFLEALKNLKVSLLAVDEAHCISEWGHDFRPDYLNIAGFRQALGGPLTAALTATATPRVQDEIMCLLGLDGRQNTCRIVTGFNRPNLFFEVRSTSGDETKLKALRLLLGQRQGGASLVYTGTRRDAELVCEFVRQVTGADAEFYHAGLPPEERTRIQNRFLSGELPVVAATNAFGMGIDRADVRQVIHYGLPGSLEAYYQEAGRAGRDGLPALAVLFYDPKDCALQEFFISNSVLSRAELHCLYDALQAHKQPQVWVSVEELSAVCNQHEVKVRVGLAQLEEAHVLEHLRDEGRNILLKVGSWDETQITTTLERNRLFQQHRREQLDRMVDYAESDDCRREKLMRHFGDRSALKVAPCCDNCRASEPPPGPGGNVSSMSEAERIPLVILDTITRFGRNIGRTNLSLTLRGSRSKTLQKMHLDKSIYYGRLATMSQKGILGVIDQLIEQGYLKSTGSKFPLVGLSQKGKNALKEKSVISIKLKNKINPTYGSLLPGKQIRKLTRTPALEAAITIILKTVQMLPGCLPRSGVAKLLVGSNSERVEKYQTHPQFGALKGHQRDWVMHIIDELLATGDLMQDEKKYLILPPSKPAATAADKPVTEDNVASFLSHPHPRPLKGPWHEGWALDFHSRFAGQDWNRTTTGELAYRLKYEGDLSTLGPLVEQAAGVIATHPALGKVDAILSVPPSKVRPKDPVEAFARALAFHLGLPVWPGLEKTRKIEPQKEKQTLAGKHANVNGAFALTQPVKSRRLLVLDDLFDSGATLEEITRLLLRSGATAVYVLTLTRTIHTDS